MQLKIQQIQNNLYKKWYPVCIRIVYVLLSSQLNFSNEPNQILGSDWSAVNQNTRLPLVGTQPFSRIYCPKALRVGLAEERGKHTIP